MTRSGDARDPRRLQAEIAETREALSGTVEELAARTDVKARAAAAIVRAWHRALSLPGAAAGLVRHRRRAS
ncbi:DUF3618 domain-containing protein [Dactylosporangium salmoneum]|uniref:Uncharacterized protein n=1 Tax=Dactylosporangium salmoneum TaxID=53361 RepID=A0ABP5SAZ1_9ACTN